MNLDQKSVEIVVLQSEPAAKANIGLKSNTGPMCFKPNSFPSEIRKTIKAVATIRGSRQNNSGNLYSGEKQLMEGDTQQGGIRLSHRLEACSLRRFLWLVLFAVLGLPSRADASLFHGETLDSIANGISWVVLIVAPIIGIAVFWLVHILPEKIAHKKMHPQTRAIQCLCLLSLCFGGLLWPIAWLWAYTKPVLHKMAYGTDVDKSLGHGGHEATEEENEIQKLRARIAELEAKNRV